jgi:putative flippase GtrA
MDITSLIEIAVVIVVIYFFIKFIVSPIVRIAVGIIILIVFIYLLQRFFGFNMDQVLSPFGVSLNPSKWNINIDWISNPVNSIIDQIKSFLSFIWGNVPKSAKP